MKKIYANFTYLLMLLLVTVFTSCKEPEDMVTPQVTCDTMARAHREPDGSIYLILEDGRILSPVNAKTTTSGQGEVNLEISGFPVKEGQQIIMGYVPATGNMPANKLQSGKKINVNCIVGVAQKASF